MKKCVFLILCASMATLQSYAQSDVAGTDTNYSRKEGELSDTGTASYYHSQFQGKPTASGEIYDEAKLTAAHNRLKFGTRVKVTNLRNKKSVIVRINDRLHYKNKRIVDLSKAAAIKLDFVTRGLTKVRVEVVGN